MNRQRAFAVLFLAGVGALLLQSCKPKLSCDAREYHFVQSAGDLRDLASCSKLYGLQIKEDATVTNLDGLAALQEVEQNLQIYGVNITDISGLSGLRSVGGALVISDHRGGTHEPLPLESLKGLENLEDVGGIQIDNTSITDLEPLGALQRAGDVTISSNKRLPSCKADQFFKRVLRHPCEVLCENGPPC